MAATVPDILFYVFAALTLLCGALVIANPFSRSPVTSAMFLVLTIISMAGLFVLLHAFFLAAVQIIVYAGAVHGAVPVRHHAARFEGGTAPENKNLRRGGGIGFRRLHGRHFYEIAGVHSSRNAAPPTLEGETYALGKLLFTQYMLPFEIVSVLLLVAMIGVILLSKKKLE